MTASISSELPEPETQRRPQDDRRIVTPYAFGVAEHLLGTPLASPYKRAIAIGIDMLLVALLTYVHSAVLAAAIAFLLMHVGRKMQRRSRYPRLRKLLIAMGGFIAFIILLSVLKTHDLMPDSSDNDVQSADTTHQLRQAGLTLAAMVKAGQIASNIEAGRCSVPLECWQGFADDIMTKSMASSTPGQKAAVAEAIVEYAGTTLNAAEQQNLSDYIAATYVSQQGDASRPQSEGTDKTSDAQFNDNPPGIEGLEADLVIPVNTADSAPDSPSLLAWVKGILSDLGLGFGWAAFYFTVFGAWWNGQSPGKKLMGIRIVKLDASPMNLWESFGRYGGVWCRFSHRTYGIFAVILGLQPSGDSGQDCGNPGHRRSKGRSKPARRAKVCFL